MITRKEYLQNNDLNAYYQQFVTEGTYAAVLQQFSIEELVAAYVEDPHLNTIELQRWDSLVAIPSGQNFHTILPYDSKLLHEAGDYPTISGLVSIAKTAARKLAEKDLRRQALDIMTAEASEWYLYNIPEEAYIDAAKKARAKIAKQNRN